MVCLFGQGLPNECATAAAAAAAAPARRSSRSSSGNYVPLDVLERRNRDRNVQLAAIAIVTGQFAGASATRLACEAQGDGLGALLPWKNYKRVVLQQVEKMRGDPSRIEDLKAAVAANCEARAFLAGSSPGKAPETSVEEQAYT
eukprot:COSAG05_NODE_4107_length_1671_cov_4.587150_1_plen_144_part_00